MMEYHTRNGPYLVTYGTYQPETAHLIFVPDGCELVMQAPPADAKLPPPFEAQWNLDDGRWEEIEKPVERVWAEVRYQRDRRLAATDWVVLRAADTGQPVPSEWLAYRQALRDVTEQGDPLTITWPTPPDA